MYPPVEVSEKRYRRLLHTAQKWVAQDKTRADTFRTARIMAVGMLTQSAANDMLGGSPPAFWLTANNKFQFLVTTYGTEYVTIRKGHVRIETYIMLPHEIQSFLIGSGSAKNYGLFEDGVRTILGLIIRRPSL